MSFPTSTNSSVGVPWWLRQTQTLNRAHTPSLSVWVGEETGEGRSGWMVMAAEVSMERVWFENLNCVGHVMYLVGNMLWGSAVGSWHFR